METEPEKTAHEWRNVRMTVYLMEALVEAATGKGNRIEWGEPDEDGYYTPVVTFHVEMTPIP